MQRNALLIGAGIIAALAVSCTLAEPGPTAVSTPPPAVAAVPPPPPPTCDPTAFLSKVRYYSDVSFHPVKNGPLPTTIALPISPNYLGGLAAAFCAAPDGFQKVLSSLDRIYINATACSSASNCFDASWGWLRKQGGTTQRLVALSSSLWNNVTYATYETLLTQAILPQSGVTYSNPQSCTVASGCRSVDNAETALLAALAHEVGHIRWFDWVNNSPANYCTPNFFSYSWKQPYHQPPAGAAGGYWRDVLTPGNRSYLRSHGDFLDRHLNPPQIDDIDNLPPGSVAQNQLIYQLLVPPMPWASLFAAMSPDEDFVETYKFKVLTDNYTSTASRLPLTSVLITVPNGLGAGSNGTADIADAYHNGWKAYLAAKVGCIMGY